MIDKTKLVTIITPTFNRANYLPILFESLQNQSSKMFDWIIVDDGSSDNTSGVVLNFKPDSFKLTFLKQNNSGKHIALNRAVELVKTDLIFVVDSDDSLTIDAIDTICNDWLSKKQDVIGISYLRQNSFGQIIGDKFTNNYLVSTHSNERIINNVRGDKAEVWKTTHFKNIPFLEFEGEKFFSEQYKYLLLSGSENVLYVNKAIYICEYLIDGLSKKIRRLQFENPNGTLANSILLSERKYPINVRVKAFLQIYAFSHLSDKRFFAVFRDSGFNITWLLLIPIGHLYKYYLMITYNYYFKFVSSK